MTAPTPLTNAAKKFGITSDACDFVHVDFARQLETALTLAQAACHAKDAFIEQWTQTHGCDCEYPEHSCDCGALEFEEGKKKALLPDCAQPFLERLRKAEEFVEQMKADISSTMETVSRTTAGLIEERDAALVRCRTLEDALKAAPEPICAADSLPGYDKPHMVINFPAIDRWWVLVRGKALSAPSEGEGEGRFRRQPVSWEQKMQQVEKPAPTVAKSVVDGLADALDKVCGNLAERVALDMDHREKDHSAWYREVQRARTNLSAYRQSINQPHA